MVCRDNYFEQKYNLNSFEKFKVKQAINEAKNEDIVYTYSQIIRETLENIR